MTNLTLQYLFVHDCWISILLYSEYNECLVLFIFCGTFLYELIIKSLTCIISRGSYKRVMEAVQLQRDVD